MKQKLFIVLEGIDGSGKSTQANLLKQYFLRKQETAIISSQPSNGIIGNLIRQALQQRIIFTKNPNLFDEQMAYLFAADRHDHLYNDIDGVFKSIASGSHVISTRYYFSSLAYNCHNPEQFDFVKQLNARFPNPDLTIYLDIPVSVSLQRLQERGQTEIYETETKLTKVRDNYQKIFADYDGTLLILDGSKHPEEIYHKIINYFEKLNTNNQRD
jgi:dTMP kinase